MNPKHCVTCGKELIINKSNFNARRKCLVCKQWVCLECDKGKYLYVKIGSSVGTFCKTHYTIVPKPVQQTVQRTKIWEVFIPGIISAIFLIIAAILVEKNYPDFWTDGRASHYILFFLFDLVILPIIIVFVMEKIINLMLKPYQELSSTTEINENIEELPEEKNLDETQEYKFYSIIVKRGGLILFIMGVIFIGMSTFIFIYLQPLDWEAAFAGGLIMFIGVCCIIFSIGYKRLIDVKK